ncbi:hypothetical protein [Streptomyces sp. NPDC047097]|uniref:hypothetical protein n=1 Tax=Streptomyces sp. NPDC047097 TaxID=3155260 RepID=UPI0033E5524C
MTRPERRTASTITDRELDELYARLDRAEAELRQDAELESAAVAAGLHIGDRPAEQRLAEVAMVWSTTGAQAARAEHDAAAAGISEARVAHSATATALRDVEQQLGGALGPDAGEHRWYLSTSCIHDEHDYCKGDTGKAGAKKPAECKWCPSKCACPCHQDEPDAPAARARHSAVLTIRVDAPSPAEALRWAGILAEHVQVEYGDDMRLATSVTAGAPAPTDFGEATPAIAAAVLQSANTAEWTAVRAIQLMNEAGRRADAAEDERDRARETARRLNRRAQTAEAETGIYRRAVAQWDVSDRGTYIPHDSLRAIGRAAGTDILGSVRHLRHFERVEQAEAALSRIESLHEQYRFAGDDGTDYCAHCNQMSGAWIPWPCPTLRALRRPVRKLPERPGREAAS